MVEKVEKRDGSIVDFHQERIIDAVNAAFMVTGEGRGVDAIRISGIVTEKLDEKFEGGNTDGRGYSRFSGGSPHRGGL